MSMDASIADLPSAPTRSDSSNGRISREPSYRSHANTSAHAVEPKKTNLDRDTGVEKLGDVFERVQEDVQIAASLHTSGASSAGAVAGGARVEDARVQRPSSLPVMPSAPKSDQAATPMFPPRPALQRQSSSGIPLLTPNAKQALVKAHQAIKQPDCAERTLSLLAAFLKLLLDPPPPPPLVTDAPALGQSECIISFGNVMEYLDKLQAQIVLEDLELKAMAEIRRGFETLITDQGYGVDNKVNIKSLYARVFAALRSIQPLDMGVLLECIIPSIQTDLSGKDIILLVGGTGAGKSTLVHFLAGSKMVLKGTRARPTIGNNLTILFRAFPFAHFFALFILPLIHRTRTFLGRLGEREAGKQ